MNNNICFSIIIPLYNQENFISQAIQSVLKQTYPHFELILINDGSTDKSESIVHGFEDDRIKLYNQQNNGVSYARNKGIEKAQNKWIVFLDADDEFKDIYLDSLKCLIEQYPDNSVFASAYEYKSIKDNSQSFPRYKFVPPLNQHGIIVNYFKSCFFGNPVIWTSAVCIRKKLFDHISGFNIKAKRGEDLDLWFRIAINNQIVFNNERLVIYRINREMSTKSNLADVTGIFPYYKWFKYRKCIRENIYVGLYIFKRLIIVIKVILANKDIKDVYKYFKQ